MWMRIKVDINKGIFLYFGRNVLYGCRENQYDLTLGDQAMNIKSHHIQDLPCMSLVLLFPECIIRLIKSACTSILLPNLDPILYKNNYSLS